MATGRTTAWGGLFVVALMMMAGFTAPLTGQIPEEFTNLQILPEDIPQRQLVSIMRGFTRALGVRCSTCHLGEEGQDLSEYDFTSDDELRERYYGLGTLNFGPRTLEDLANGLSRADDLPGALAALDLNLGLYPESANSWTLKGQVHMRSGQTEEAIAALERSLELLPGNPRVLQVLERLKGGG